MTHFVSPVLLYFGGLRQDLRLQLRHHGSLRQEQGWGNDSFNCGYRWLLVMVGCICLIVLLSLLLCHNDDVNLNRQVKQWLLAGGWLHTTSSSYSTNNAWVLVMTSPTREWLASMTTMTDISKWQASMVTMTSSIRHKDANGNDWSVVSTYDKSKLKLSRQPAGGSLVLSLVSWWWSWWRSWWQRWWCSEFSFPK